MAQKIADQVIEAMPWLDPLADTIQQAVTHAIQAGGPPADTAKDILHGRWLGHPLHPALVSIPLGAWTVTLLCDLLGAEDAADLSLLIGIVGAGGAAVSGMADWNETSGTNRRTGLLHALLNSVALSLNVTSLVLRRQDSRTSGVTLSTLAYAIGNLSAFLGGELAYAKGIGVNHTAWDAAPSEFTVALEAAALKENTPVRGDAAGVPIVLVKKGNEILALDATCTHAGGPLNEGTVEGDTIICPWHGSAFCLRDGSTQHGPATEPAIRFTARIRDGKVEVKRAD